MKYSIHNSDLEKYENICKIGQGSFGEITLVKCKETKKEYVKKGIKKKLNYNYLNELKENIKTIKFLLENKNECIIKVYKIGIKFFDNFEFELSILMNKAECNWNQEIEMRNKNKKYYSKNELREILHQLAIGFYFLQKNKIAHCDIKPDNILIFSKDAYKYKISDFGEAKHKIDNIEKTKPVAGTELFMSPLLYYAVKEKKDQIKNNIIKSDVYSLGICFLYAIFLDINIVEDLIKKIRKPPKLTNMGDMPYIKQLILNKISDKAKYGMPKYSDKFMNIIFRMLEIEEEKRYDFIELEESIRKIL